MNEIPGPRVSTLHEPWNISPHPPLSVLGIKQNSVSDHRFINKTFQHQICKCTNLKKLSIRIFNFRRNVRLPFIYATSSFGRVCFKLSTTTEKALVAAFKKEFSSCPTNRTQGRCRRRHWKHLGELQAITFFWVPDAGIGCSFNQGPTSGRRPW